MAINALYQLAANQPQINALQLSAAPRVSQYREPDLSAAYQVMLEGTRGFENLDPIRRYVAARQSQQGLDANTLQAQASANLTNERANALAQQVLQSQGEHQRRNALMNAIASHDWETAFNIDPAAAQDARDRYEAFNLKNHHPHGQDIKTVAMEKALLNPYIADMVDRFSKLDAVQQKETAKEALKVHNMLYAMETATDQKMREALWDKNKAALKKLSGIDDIPGTPGDSDEQQYVHFRQERTR